MFPNEFLRNSEIEHLHEYKQLLLDQHVQIVQTICKKVKIMKNIQEISTTTDIQLKVVNYSNKKNDWKMGFEQSLGCQMGFTPPPIPLQNPVFLMYSFLERGN